jgi:hypothetical protein
MSYIDSTRRSITDGYEYTVCITIEECKAILPFIQKAYNAVVEKYEKYDEIHRGGYANERQENLRIKYEDKMAHLGSILADINSMLKTRN